MNALQKLLVIATTTGLLLAGQAPLSQAAAPKPGDPGAPVYTTPNKSVSTYLLDPSDDAFVRGGEYADTVHSYGAGSRLVFKHSPDTPETERQSYFRFDTSTVLGTVSSGSLELRPELMDVAGANGGYFVVARTETDWDEHTLTFNNRPDRLGDLYWGMAVSGGSNHSVPLDAATLAEINAGRPVSFTIYDPSTRKYMEINSKENAGNPVRLKLNIDYAQAQETPAYSYNSRRANQDPLLNNNSKTEIQLWSDPTLTKSASEGYITFNIADIDASKSNKLHFFVQNKNGNLEVKSTVGIYTVKEEIDADVIDRATVLTREDKLGTIVVERSEQNWFSVDVSEAVRKAKEAGKKRLTFAFHGENGSTNLWILNQHNVKGNFLYPYIQTRNATLKPNPVWVQKDAPEPERIRTKVTNYTYKNYRYTLDNAPVYTSQSTKAKKVMTIPAKKEVKLATASKKGWTKVTYEGKTGWAQKSFFEKKTKQYAYETVRVESPDKSYYTYSTNRTSTLKATEENTLLEWNSSKDLGTVPAGTKLTKVSAPGTMWTKVTTPDGTQGYLLNSHITRYLGYTTKVTETKTLKSTMWTRKTKVAATAYSGTTSSKKKVFTIPKDTVVRHHSSKGAWKQIEYKGRKAWVHVDNLT